MRTLVPLLVASAALGVFTGCDEWQRILSKVNPDPVGEPVGEPSAPALGCADIDGTFTADALVFTSEADPAIVEDYDDHPDFAIVFDRRTSTFEAMLLDGEEVLVTAGEYGIIGDWIVFESPLVAGAAGTHTALLCEYNGLDLTLYGSASYDFADDAVDGPVDADFVGTFVAED